MEYIIFKVIKLMESNINNEKSIDPIKIKLISDTNEFEEMPCVGPGNVGVIPLDPPGPVSLYLWHTHSEFRAGSFLTRKSILRQTIVSLHERFTQELKERHWNRKKAIMQLEEQETSAVSPNQITPELNKALCYVLGFQYAEVDEIHKKVFWYPSDIRTWTKEQPIYLVSLGCRSVYINKHDEEARTYFSNWLMKLDYTCVWPIEDGTVKELKEKAEQLGQRLSLKAKKEEYQEIVGKTQAIRHIINEFSIKL